MSLPKVLSFMNTVEFPQIKTTQFFEDSALEITSVFLPVMGKILIS